MHILRHVFSVAVINWALCICLSQEVSAQTFVDQIDERLRNRIEAGETPPQIVVRGERLYASVALPNFYEKRIYKPAWIDENGPRQHVVSLVKAIREADQEGLRPTDYHLVHIGSLLHELQQDLSRKAPLAVGTLLDLELLLTDAFLVYGSHLLMGRINPESIDPEWQANRRDADFAQVLQEALDSDRIEETLKSMIPPQPGYSRLRQALASYRDLAGGEGWPLVSEGPKMQKGDRGERVVTLHRRLAATGDVTESLKDDDIFDDEVEQAVRRFQDRHGLDIDGVVGPVTLAALNIPVEDRIHQIELNLERWRWLPQELGSRYILVNIANFELDVIENGAEMMTMRVIVGKEYRRTPVFSDRMTYLVLCPYWYVPTNIAIEDVLPLIRQDLNYLTEQWIRVFQGWDSAAREIDPQKIDWSEITAQNFSYRFRQDPGPHNALGRVKFMFPNKFNVYFHDTPARNLFTRSERTFSSGCIRIEKPIELSEYVLRDDPKWTRAALLAAIEKRREQTIRLPEPIPVHLLYWTAWVGEDGTVHFRRDIYGRDTLLQEALSEVPPAYTQMN